MDADKTLAAIRDAIARASDAESDSEALDCLTSVSQDVDNLDAYLSNGGALPKEWQQ